MAKTVDTSKVWVTKAKDRPMDGLKVCEPWIKKEDIPGFSFKTSTQVGLKYEMPHFKINEMKPLNVAKENFIRDYRFRDMQYQTASKNDYTWKINPNNDPLDRANRVSGVSALYIKSYQEKITKNTFAPPRTSLSNYKDNYKFNEFSSSNAGVLKNQRPDLFCKIQGLTRDDQPKIDPNLGGIFYELETYSSTAHRDHYFIPRERAEAFKSFDVDLTPSLEPRTQPIYDEAVFKTKFLDRVIPRKPKRVPNSGMGTEFRSAYKIPLSEFSHKSLGVEFNVKLPPLSKGDVMSVPAMYHTEYSHMGTDWSLRALL